MNAPDPSASLEGGHLVSDSELLSRWLDERQDDDGATSVAVFIRYRELVRSELERVGLPPLEAVKRVATVFYIAQGHHPAIPDSMALRERLVTVAREVGRDESWSPPI